MRGRWGTTGDATAVSGDAWAEALTLIWTAPTIGSASTALETRLAPGMASGLLDLTVKDLTGAASSRM